MDKKQLIKRGVIIGIALLVIALVLIFGERSFFGKEGNNSDVKLEEGSRLFKGPTGTPYVKGPTTSPPGIEVIE